MYQQLWGYKVEEKLYVGVREQKRLNTAAPADVGGVTLASVGGQLGPGCPVAVFGNVAFYHTF